MPRVRICQDGPTIYASSPFVVASYVYHCPGASSIAVSRWQKQQHGSSEMKLQRTLAPCGTLSSLTLVLVLDKACRELRSWRTHTRRQSSSESRSRTSNPRSTSNTHQRINFDLMSYRATHLTKSWPLTVVEDASISTCYVCRLFVIKQQLAKPMHVMQDGKYQMPNPRVTAVGHSHRSYESESHRISNY